MKRRFTFLLTAAMLLMSCLAWAQTTAVLPNTQALTTEFVNVGEDENIQIKTSSANTFTNPLRFYANVTATIQAINDTQILSITYEASSTGNYVTNAQNASVTPQVEPTVEGKNVTWDYTSSPCTTFTFKPTAQTRCNSITIVYLISSSSVSTPTFTPAAGTYTEAQTVTISCETENATIYYTTDGSTPDNTSTEYTGAISVAETTTIKAIAYVGESASNVASATYTILTPMTIAEVREQGTGAVYTSGTVTSCVGTTGYIQDATAAICVFGTSLTIGDNISVQGSLTTYNGLLEITNPVVTVISSGNTVEPEVMTIAEINASTNQGWYVRIENATVTNIDGDNTTISQEGNSILVYKITGVELAVNDIVSLNGNIGNHNGIQIANPKDVTVQQSEEPAIIVDPTTVDVPCAAAEGTLTVTYQNIDMELGADIYWYESDGTTSATYDWVEADFDDDNNVYYVISANTGDARTAYMKVYGIGTDESEVYSDLITFSQGQYVADYAELPFEFDGTYSDIATISGLTEGGLGNYSSAPHLKFDGSGDWLLLHFIETPGTLAFDLKANPGSNGWSGTFTVQTSEDGQTYTDLATYTSISTEGQSEEFTTLGENVRYIKWIYTEKVNGNVALGNITLAKYVEPVLVASITVTPELVEVDATEHEGTLGLAYENLEISDMNDFIVVYFDNQGGSIDDPDWIEVSVAEQDSQIGEGYVVSYYMLENVGEARSAFFKVIAMVGDEDFVYSNLVTVNQAAYVAPGTGNNYELFTGNLVEGDYLIVYDGKAMNNIVDSDRLQYIEVTPNNNVIVTEDAAVIWHIAPAGDYWTIYSANASAYAASTGAKNKAQMLDDGTDDKALWTVSGTETYEFVNKKNTANGVNANLRNNGTYGFACYATSTGGALSLYKKVVEPETHTLYIPGYSNATNPEGGYYLIASPVTVNPEDVEGDPQGMIDGNFDLYYFDQAEENEWRNYEAQPFNLVPGKGYLYAHDTDVELTFTGTPYSGNREFPLSYTEDAVFAGWNLIGNPYNYNVTVDKDFYIMNEDGDEIITPEEGMPILPMQGFFVVATAAGQTVTFSEYVAPIVPIGELVLNLNHNRGTVIDRAIVRFGEGEQLPKFQLFENSTKLYIPQGNNDYAVVRSEAQGEMPVNFKAKENGTYTISVNTENVEMDYLHLIDNMTGTDVDLLQTPSYTFEASTRDYASRFRLVFSAEENGASAGSATFAYFNGNEWVVSNEGEAQLHVIDMTGRIVSTETINGNATVKVNAAPGVYMLRLINGNDIKTQKVIIK